MNNAAADFRCRVRLPRASLLVYGVGDNATSGPSPHFRLPFESSRWRPIGMVYLSGQPNSLRWTSCSFGRDKYAFLFIFLLFLSVTRVCSLSLSLSRKDRISEERKKELELLLFSLLSLSLFLVHDISSVSGQKCRNNNNIRAWKDARNARSTRDAFTVKQTLYPRENLVEASSLPRWRVVRKIEERENTEGGWIL